MDIGKKPKSILKTLPKINIEVKKSEDEKHFKIKIDGFKNAIYNAYNKG